MEKHLKFGSLLSLKEMALRKVATLLWCDSSSLVHYSQFRKQGYSNEANEKEWRETIEPNIKNKVLKLKLPESVTKQIIEIVGPIGLQVKRWKDHQEYHMKDGYQEFIIPNSEKLCWTSAGLIDYRKTAEELVCCDVLDVVTRYVLACTNCLENCIPLLWEKLPEEKKDYFYLKLVNDGWGCPQPSLPCCWPFIIKGELSTLDRVWKNYGITLSSLTSFCQTLFCQPSFNDTSSLIFTHTPILTSFNQWGFIFSVSRNNKVATEYFFKKLTHEEREASLMKSAKGLIGRKNFEYIVPKEGSSEIACFLLSLMNPEQQMEMLKEHPARVFSCFIDSSWPDVFLENVGLLWSFLPPCRYEDLLQKVTPIFEDHYFPKVFQEFFIQSPLDFKKCFEHDFISNYSFKSYECIRNLNYKSYAARFFTIFFNFEDSECIKVIFRNLPVADRLGILIQFHVTEFFYQCMLKGRWQMVELCLQEATLSNEDRAVLKERFMYFLKIRNIRPLNISNPKWKRFFEFLDETHASSDKEKKAQKRKLDACCPE